MKKKAACLLSVVALAIAGCASTTTGTNVADCCSAPEVIYVDKAVAECTHSVQRVVQTNPCASCERFPVSARLDGGCSR